MTSFIYDIKIKEYFYNLNKFINFKIKINLLISNFKFKMNYNIRLLNINDYY